MEAALDAIVRGTRSCDELLSATHERLLHAATELARASYFKDAADRDSNKEKAALVHSRVTPFSAQALPGQSIDHQEWCNRVRQYLWRNMKAVNR
mmetsp:Transcript_4451/g.14194  ORF Transcript_4451/g.14194 Transcript_4451/m.14194 type:complete len:95 (+) Transcript_4451:252-536(+)